MTIRFTKAPRETGVDGFFQPDDTRVTIEPSEFPKPLYPEDEGFWDEFSDTLDMVCAAHDRALNRREVSPLLGGIAGSTARSGADLVHSDFPTAIMTEAVLNLKKPTWRDFGLRNGFTDGPVLLGHLIGWASHVVSPNSFCAKWHFMVPRPEEVAGAIARGELDAPEMIQQRLFNMVPRSVLAGRQEAFTVYDEGCPNHPSYNAMHSAAAGAQATVIKVLFDLSEEQTAQVNLAARNMAFFRSNAGVHYPQDNRAGLWLGQETVSRLLSDKMREFGADSAEVQAAIDAAQTDFLGA